jgi:Arc/MetJ-type ribon-helix-helix transcriptional regulator
MVSFRLGPPTSDALDAWIVSQPEPRPSRSEAIRIALRDWLTGLGLLKHREDPEGAS